MTSMNKSKYLKKVRKRKISAVYKNVAKEIIFWIFIDVDDMIWGYTPLKEVVKAYWQIEDSLNDRLTREDEFDGVYYASEHYVNFLVDQIFYLYNVKLNAEKVLASITTVDLVRMVLVAKGLITFN